MKGYVVLENGEIFEGILQNGTPNIQGELIFYTGMTGYEQLLVNPASKGQIIVFTYPLIGNCGISEATRKDATIQASGIMVNEVSAEGFHYESSITLADYSKDSSVPLLSGIDTRAIVKRIREHGEMRAILTTDPDHVQFDYENQINEQSMIEEMSTAKMRTLGNGHHHLVVIDYGDHQSIVDSLLHKGYKVTLAPYKTTFSEIEQLQPDGVIYTNGPGNPAQLRNELPSIKLVAMTYPTFGVGLGHQLLAQAFGAETEKLTSGHRGLSQPVIDKKTNKVFMTAQNHSYAVKEQLIEETGFQTRFLNVNDQTIEGLVHENYPIMTTQFNPIGYQGPSDSESLFFSFFEMVSNKGREKVYA